MCGCVWVIRLVLEYGPEWIDRGALRLTDTVRTAIRPSGRAMTNSNRTFASNPNTVQSNDTEEGDSISAGPDH